MDMKKTGFRKIIGGVLLATLSNVAVAQSSSLPEFHIVNQSLSTSLFFSPDVNVFSLGGLEDLISTPYKASFESISGAAMSNSPSMDTNYNLQITPVPETEVWGVILAGLGLLGAIATRRQRGDAAAGVFLRNLLGARSLPLG